MALSERSRTASYQNLEPLLAEEAVGEMLSYFPARDVEEPATKEFVRAEIAGLRGDLTSGLADLRADMAEMRAEFHKDQREILMWPVGLLATFIGLGIAVIAMLA